MSLLMSLFRCPSNWSANLDVYQCVRPRYHRGFHCIKVPDGNGGFIRWRIRRGL